MSKPSIYEVRVNRVVNANDYVDLMVRARSPQAAEKKALRIVRRDQETWFGPVATDTFLEADEPEKIDFEPDCEVY